MHSTVKISGLKSRQRYYARHLVLEEHEILSSGGKISVPKVNNKIEMILKMDML